MVQNVTTSTTASMTASATRELEEATVPTPVRVLIADDNGPLALADPDLDVLAVSIAHYPLVADRWQLAGLGEVRRHPQEHSQRLSQPLQRLSAVIRPAPT